MASLRPSSAASPKPKIWRIKNIETSERDDAENWLRAQAQELGLPECQGFSVDIVAVTGLGGGHALGSFRSTDGKIVWLRDFTPYDVPRARFITYGYDTAVIASDNREGVSELAQTLLDYLAILCERTRTQDRPLLFVCHSLGGVVLNEVLVRSSKISEENHKKLREIEAVTHGLMFMGVPNLGLKHDQLITWTKGQANERLIRNLLVDPDAEASEFLPT